MTRERQPQWLVEHEILAIHEMLLAAHGGALGIRDKGLLESAICCPKNLWAYEKADLFALAASYADGIANGHAFVDGNKRTGFLAAALFLEIHDCVFLAPEEEVVTMTVGLANKSISAAQYAQWLRFRCGQ